MQENLSEVTAFAQTEHGVVAIVQWLKLGIEVLGAAIIALGILAVAGQLLRALWGRRATDFTSIRLTLARYLALALEFQLGADILSTAIAPSWDQIRNLGAIAIIRTALNYFLFREMQEERAQSQAEAQAEVQAAPREDNGPVT